MKIGGSEIGNGEPPYIVAEISGNHGGSLENAKRLIRAAKRAGADAVKTQCYEPDDMTLDITKTDFIIQDGIWKGQTLYELYKKTHTPLKWHKDLYRVAREENITIFSSVFHWTSIDLLEDLGCPAYKIASFEIADTPLIEHAAKTGKPLIISTGLARGAEVLDAQEAAGDCDRAFLHCISEYPADVSLARLGRIDWLRKLVSPNPVGLSDHTKGYIAPIAATALRVAIIEKHIKLEKLDAEDAQFSLAPSDFSDFVKVIKSVWKGLGDTEEESGSRQFRRSLYAIEDIEEGEPYTTSNVKAIRPGYGLPPKMLAKLLGRKSRRKWRRGDALS